MRAASRGARAATRAGLLVLGLALAGCSGMPQLASEPRAMSVESRLLAHEAVLLRGWISDAGAGLEPVVSMATAAADNGGASDLYVLYGMADDGAIVFDLRFGNEALAGVSGRAERYFVFPVTLSSADASSLAQVVLQAGGVRYVLGRSAWSREQLIAGLTGARGVQLAALSDGRVAVTWDAERFELLQLRDPATGAVLALDRDGEVTVPAPEGELEIVLSDGIRSAAALFRTAENP